MLTLIPFELSMAKGSLSGKLTVILHADVAGSTALVHQDEQLAHERIQGTFHRFGTTITKYHGRVRELRGDALLAEFERASDAVTAALAFQADQIDYNTQLNDSIQPTVRVGIAMGEVVIADNTITGTGVILAQRLEQLSKPGGVVIQGAAYETIPGRFPFEYGNLGEQEVKGFDQPVRVYSANLKSDTDIPQPGSPGHRTRNSIVVFAAVAIIITGIALMWFKPWEVREEPASVERMAYPLPDKPSIAVLPFTNMSGDAEQEYFVDGMTEDLITDLSQISGLFVIARNSVFTYKDKPIKIRQVAEELGVRYVLEGSVRRAADKVRINAQLIDATTGGHLWAERYDGTLTDVFGLQDAVVRQIVGALAVNLTTTESTRTRLEETSVAAAYDAFLQGRDHYRNRTPEDYAKAISFFEKAIELDPDYNRAYAVLAGVYWELIDLNWETLLGMQYQAGNRAKNYLAKALEHPTGDAYRVSAEMLVNLGQGGEALREIDRAIALMPNDPDVLSSRAWILTVSGRAPEAEDDARKAIRLDPAHPTYLIPLGRALFHQERYEEAVEIFESVVIQQPEYEYTYPFLAATYGYLGRIEEAKAAVAKFHDLANNVSLTLQGWESWYEGQYQYDKAYLAQYIEGLRKAKVEEGSTNEFADLDYKTLVTKSEGTFDVKGAIKIDAIGAKALNERGVLFIDSRPGYRYESGHIPGAANLYFIGEFNRSSLSQLVGFDQEVVFYCGDKECHLSPNACAKALTWGYTKVYYFAGGFLNWGNAGYAVEL
jgi:TolB-like protein/class 3 adenylate cyclase/tetratricopeptide (TPR) repeat protein